MYMLSSKITALEAQTQPPASTKPPSNQCNARAPTEPGGPWSLRGAGQLQPQVEAQYVCEYPGPERFPKERELYTSSRVGFCLCLRHWNVDASEIWSPLISAASGWGGAEVPDPVPWPESQTTNTAVGSPALEAWEGYSPLCQGNQICDSHTLPFTNIIDSICCNAGHMLSSQICVYVGMDYSHAEFNPLQRPT